MEDRRVHLRYMQAGERRAALTAVASSHGTDTLTAEISFGELKAA
jgi:hypothetical protein